MFIEIYVTYLISVVFYREIKDQVIIIIIFFFFLKTQIKFKKICTITRYCIFNEILFFRREH